YAARREVVRECRLDISTPETIPEPQANRQIEHHIDVRPSFPAGWHDRRPKLEVFASTLVEAEADAQTFSFPPAGNREHDICVSSGRGQIQVGLNVEFEIAQRLCAAPAISMRQQQISSESNKTAHRIRLFIEDRMVQVR